MNQQDIDIRQLLPTGALLQGGKYRVERYLSSGNFGNTYVVTHTGLGVQFAMKEFFLGNICYRVNQGLQVYLSPAVDPKKVNVHLEKFKKEAQRLYGLKSQHLAHVHDMFSENGTEYYIMDFIEGVSLAKYIEQHDNHPLSEEQVFFVLRQILDGLEEVHSKQIWHLDLKPDNIMIDKKGDVVIIDFGASKQVGRSGKYTGTSDILCYTPGYAPNEQVNQNLNEIGPWTDIYALGATIYNLVTATDPSKQNGKTLQFPRQVSPAMYNLIMKMTNSDMDKRPQNIAEVRKLLPEAESLKPNSLQNEGGVWDLEPDELKRANVRLNKIVDEQNSEINNLNQKLNLSLFALTVVIIAGLYFGKQILESDIHPSNVANLSVNDYIYYGDVNENKIPNGIGFAHFIMGDPQGRLWYYGGFENGVRKDDNGILFWKNGSFFQGSIDGMQLKNGLLFNMDEQELYIGEYRDGREWNGAWYSFKKEQEYKDGVLIY